MLNLVSAHIIHLILENDFYLYSHKWLYISGFQTSCGVYTKDVKRVREMLCEYILKETIDRKGKFYSGAPWVYCDQKLETHSVFFSQVLLPEKPAWLAWLGSDTAWYRLFSHDSIQTSPDENNLKLDVILASLSIMWSCFANICDVRMCLWCLLAVVAAISWLVPRCSPWWLPNSRWFQDAVGNQAGYYRDGRRICNGH
jgi:hypothetical protein